MASPVARNRSASIFPAATVSPSRSSAVSIGRCSFARTVKAGPIGFCSVARFRDNGTPMDVPTARIRSLDALRGAVMILMALDHIRDFIHRGAMSFSPTDLARTTPALFFTRWVTHFCAPVFMFAAGAGAFLWWQRNHSKGQLSRFLWTRGLWLIILELTIMKVAYYFHLPFRDPVLLLVLWALGACMIMLAALIYLPLTAVAVLSVALILLHNIFDS